VCVWLLVRNIHVCVCVCVHVQVCVYVCTLTYTHPSATNLLADGFFFF